MQCICSVEHHKPVSFFEKHCSLRSEGAYVEPELIFKTKTTEKEESTVSGVLFKEELSDLLSYTGNKEFKKKLCVTDSRSNLHINQSEELL